MIWDKWQQQLIDHKGSVTARCGRQTGKSTAVGRRAANNLLDFEDCVMLMIAPAQRQSSELFNKCRSWLEVENQAALVRAGGFKPDPRASSRRNMELRRQFEYDKGIYNELPTRTTIVLKKDCTLPQGIDNRGSICYSLPAGKTAVYLRCYALDFLYVDEAAFVPDVVYDTLKPMLAISAKTRGLGWECLLSTPFGKGGFFYHSHHSDDYRQFHVSAEDCKRYDIVFLKKEKTRLTKAMYAQEYLAEFMDEWNQFFSTDLIKSSMTFIGWDKAKDYKREARYYLGVDFAGYGGDENAFVICELLGQKLKIVKTFTTERISATDTIGRINKIDSEWNFNKIFVDDGGLGSPITDALKEKLGRKVEGLNNARKRVEVQGEEKKQGIFKEDLYTNTLMLLETKKLELINDLTLLRSMKSITFEYKQDSGGKRNIKIWGEYSHLTEALVRACWCIKERGLSLYLY